MFGVDSRCLLTEKNFMLKFLGRIFEKSATSVVLCLLCGDSCVAYFFEKIFSVCFGLGFCLYMCLFTRFGGRS